MGTVDFAWGRNSEQDSTKSQFELRSRWEVADVAKHFHRVLNASLLGFVGRVEKVFSPPQSTGLLFEFGPGMHDAFAQLVDKTAFPAKTLTQSLEQTKDPQVVVPDNPGPDHRDAVWRRLAAGAAIGASFREEGTDTSLHIAFNKTLCDVHVDRNGFVTMRDGYVHWDLNKLLQHLTIDLAGDKAPWVLGSATYLDGQNRPLVEATVGPWLAVDLPAKGETDRVGVTVGLIVSGRF